MRIVLERDVVAPPGDPRNLITGTERAALLACKKPFWAPSVRMGRFVAEYDGQTNNAASAPQRSTRKTGVIRFVDEGRFIGECSRDDVTTLRLPFLIQSVVAQDGRFYSTLPLAVAKDVTQVRLSEALSSSGFQPVTHDLYKMPCFALPASDYSIGELFGPEFIDLWPMVRSLARHGPGEAFLQTLQLDYEHQQLFTLSSQLPTRSVADPDEIETILSLIAAPSLTAMFTMINLVNAMQAVRYATVLNSSDDREGLSLLFYYALQHSAYLTQIPADVFRALSAPDAGGVCTIAGIGGTNLATPLNAQLPADLRHFAPMLGQLSDTMFESLMRARVAYKMLTIVRFLEAKGIQPSPTHRFSLADRDKLFKLIA